MGVLYQPFGSCVSCVYGSFLGPAEVAAWGLLGTLWNALELVTHAVASAGGIRTAYLLGAGRPAEAKLSSYKTLYLGISAAVLYTAIVFVAGDDIPTWLTNDPTLQRMIADLVPLFGIGNIALSIGTMSWTLVGAQSRFRLSTWVNWAGAWFVMMPLAGLLTIAYNVNLQGQTAAIVIGYMVSGTINTLILLQSDWPKLSQRVIDRAGGVIDENDDSSVSSSHCSESLATKRVETAPMESSLESSLHSDASKE
jgi:Na+-driven multidrug efflux pump